MVKSPSFIFSIAILAGGQSKRMGQNKALLKLNNTSILQRVIKTVKNLSNNIFLVTNTPQIYAKFQLPMVPDAITNKAALGGIYTAILHAKHPWVLVLACDMPFLNPNVITFLANQCYQTDIVIPLVHNHPETLHAFYKKSCLPAIKKRLLTNQLKVIGFFDDVQVKTISKTTLQKITSDFSFLTNINTPQEFAVAKELLKNNKI